MKKVRLVLGQKQAEALIEAAMYGIEDLKDLAYNGDLPGGQRIIRDADRAVSVLTEANRKSKEAS